MNVRSIVKAEPGYTLQASGYLEGKVEREYPIIAWGLTPGDPSEGRFSTVGRQVIPIVLGDQVMPLCLFDLNEKLINEGIENISYVYFKNGQPAYKKGVLPAPLKRQG